MKTVLISILAFLFVLVGLLGFVMKVLHWPYHQVFMYSGSIGALITLVILLVVVIRKKQG